jgi:DNA repair protein SbcC/Rad50
LSRDSIVEQLRSALNDFGSARRTITTVEECPTSDLVLATDCYISFFAVIERAEMLADIYLRAQGEIVRAQSTNEGKWPRDLNLVLLLAADTAPNFATIRELVDDRFVCRKFVLSVNGGEIRKVLTDLPFWPPGELLRGIAPSVATGVQETVRGYDPRLIAELASHTPGAERISKKIQDGDYSFAGDPLKSPSGEELTSTPTVQNKLAAVEIIDFRGLRHLRRDKMSLASDVVFIYGPNGVGKTSIADAVEWAITGQVERLQKVPSNFSSNQPNPFVNVFSNNGHAEVTCYLSSGDHISRTYDGRKTQRSIGSHKVTEDRAVIDYVVGTKAATPEARLRIERLRDLFRGSHILTQHNIRRFLQETEPSERFDILTNMIGAEEFVRFREKVTAVLRYLRTDTDSAVEQSISLKRELEDVSTRHRTRQNELEQLSQSITSGRTLQQLSEEVLDGLKESECDVNETATQIASAATVEHKSELLAIQAEAAIRRKKAAIEDVRLRLKSLELELGGYIDSKSHCNNLTAKIIDAKSQSEKLDAEIQKLERSRRDIQDRLRDDKTKQTQTARRVASLEWTQENVTALHVNQQKRRQIEQSLLTERKQLDNSEVNVSDLQTALIEKQVRLEEVQKEITVNTRRDHALLGLLQRLPTVQAKWQEAVQFENRGSQLNSRLGELRQSERFAIGELNSSQARLNELQRLYGSEAARTDLLNSFLARLQELVRSSECPLCGTVFSSTEEAKNRISEHLSAVPGELKDLASRLDEAKKDVENKQANSGNLILDASVGEAELQQVASSMAIAKKSVSEFITECAQMDVQLSQDEVNTWQEVLEQARVGYRNTALRTEAVKLPDEIGSLAAQITEKKNIVSGFRQRVTELEKELQELLLREREFDAEIVQRGIDRSLVRLDSQLNIQLSTMQEMAKQFNELVVEKEAALVQIESATVGYRESLRGTQEDIASSETQLRQYQSTCNRFIAACQALGVDPEQPKASIDAFMQRTEEVGAALASLEKKIQVLQQVVSITKLKIEVVGLERGEQDVNKQLEVAAEKESRLTKWMSHFQKLEADVVRRQVDVVGAHLKRLEPTLQQLYQRLNQHPVFGRLRIRIDEKKHELDVDAEPSVAQERLGDLAVSPSAFFSDAQMNTLAISVFLAGALRQRWSGLSTILIDDPIQQMDEMNVNAFLDLIRGLSGHRQFIIFTCSRDFYLLALDKLDCLNKSKQGSFSAYRLEGVAPAEFKVHCDAH